MTTDDIFIKVRSLLVDALSVDDDEVALTSRLQADLGAESIDMLDIIFRLEREFNLGKIDRNELFPESIFQGDPELVDNGIVTPKGLDYLREKLPYADQSQIAKFAKAPKLEEIGDLFTVDLIVRFVGKKLSV
ncbi:MAG: acyl carrier protein [Fimbriiglobus sp.]